MYAVTFYKVTYTYFRICNEFYKQTSLVSVYLKNSRLPFVSYNDMTHRFSAIKQRVIEEVSFKILC